MARLGMRAYRRRSFRDRSLEKLLIALLHEATNSPESVVGRWVGRILIAAIVLLSVLGLIVVAGAGVAIVAAVGRSAGSGFSIL